MRRFIKRWWGFILFSVVFLGAIGSAVRDDTQRDTRCANHCHPRAVQHCHEKQVVCSCAQWEELKE